MFLILAQSPRKRNSASWGRAFPPLAGGLGEALRAEPVALLAPEVAGAQLEAVLAHGGKLALSAHKASGWANGGC